MAKVISAGSLLIKERLPTAVAARFDPSRVLDKSGVKDLVSHLITEGGDEAHTALSNVSSLFFNKATEHGYTTPILDYENDSAERNALLSEFSSKVNRIVESDKLSSKDKNQKLSNLLADYGGKAQKSNIDYMVSKGSTAGKMAQTGARGTPANLMQATFSPMMARDIHNNPIPVPIKRSFAEGLSAVEHLAMSYEGRANVVKTQTSTAEPGFLFKTIAPNMYHEVVTINDCGTKNGLMVNVANKKDVVWRVPAGDTRPIRPADYKLIEESGQKQVKLRNVQTCEAPQGVCQLCYGIDSRGQLPEIGENVGTIGAQSVSEVLTQAVLATKHKSNVGKTSDPFKDAQNLLKMTKNFSDEATIATIEGTVTRIDKTALGDFNVFVGNVAHFVPNEQNVIVKVGQKVRPGDALSTGTINPVTYTNLRGLGAGRSYYAKALKEAYDQPDLDSRHFDLLARNMMKYVKVEDPGGTDLLPGDVVEVAKIFPELKKDVETIPTRNATGKKLAVQVLDVMPGTVLDKHHVEYLIQAGVDSVKISKSGIAVKPLVRGVDFSKALDPNWLSRMALNRIPEQVMTAAALGHTSPIHSTDPIAAYVMGSEFGQGQQGRY